MSIKNMNCNNQAFYQHYFNKGILMMESVGFIVMQMPEAKKNEINHTK